MTSPIWREDPQPATRVRTQDYELTAGAMTVQLLDYAACFAMSRMGQQPPQQRELPSGYVDYYDLVHMLRGQG